jgi:hypothetical protein
MISNMTLRITIFSACIALYSTSSSAHNMPVLDGNYTCTEDSSPEKLIKFETRPVGFEYGGSMIAYYQDGDPIPILTAFVDSELHPNVSGTEVFFSLSRFQDNAVVGVRGKFLPDKSSQDLFPPAGIEGNDGTIQGIHGVYNVILERRIESTSDGHFMVSHSLLSGNNPVTASTQGSGIDRIFASWDQQKKAGNVVTSTMVCRPQTNATRLPY